MRIVLSSYVHNIRCTYLLKLAHALSQSSVGTASPTSPDVGPVCQSMRYTIFPFLLVIFALVLSLVFVKRPSDPSVWCLLWPPCESGWLHRDLVTFRTTSDLIREWAFAGDPLPTFGDVYHVAAKYGLVIRDCLRISDNYILVAENWMKNFQSRTNTPDCPFDEHFKHLVISYLQMVPVFAISNQAHTYQITCDKIKFEPSCLYWFTCIS